MNPSRYQWLAGVIFAHPENKVVGRTRLQKTIRLLQRLGFPTDYSYQLYFYGPYSDGLMSEIRLIEQFELVTEEQKFSNGDPYYIIQAKPDAHLPEIDLYLPLIEKMSNADSVVLELAATYDAFRDLGSDHEKALVKLRNKKGEKCDRGNQEKALDLLKELGLSAS